VLRLASVHQGGPGLAHGGIVAAALDEAMGILAQHVAFPAVTARMEVRFRSPVPTGVDLDIEARVIRVAGRQITTASTISRAGESLAEGDGIFVQVPLRHFLRTPEGRAQARALRDRLRER
jgi:acyl-coenzyme A thioesterase PaaI-like protein